MAGAKKTARTACCHAGRMGMRWMGGLGRRLGGRLPSAGEQLRGNRRKLAIGIYAGDAGTAAPGSGQLAQERRLQVFACRLPDQADRAAGEGDVVARLDAVEILEEEAAARVHPLAVILGFQQVQGLLPHALAQWAPLVLAEALPVVFLSYPAVAQRQIAIARRPRLVQRLGRFTCEDLVEPRREMV